MKHQGWNCVFPQGHVNMAMQDQACSWKQSHTQNISLGWDGGGSADPEALYNSCLILKTTHKTTSQQHVHIYEHNHVLFIVLVTSIHNICKEQTY